MDSHTEGVTLPARTVKALLDLYAERLHTLARPLVELVQPYDLSAPDAPIPIQVYNDMCAWIAQTLGTASLQNAGIRLAEGAFQHMREHGYISDSPTPLQVLQALVRLSGEAVHDPQGRGWEILEAGERHAVLRLTQTFHTTLQLGLLMGLIMRSTGLMPIVHYRSEVARGDLYDEFVVKWQGTRLIA